MKDGQTRRVATQPSGGQGFLATHTVSIVFATGPLAGSEVTLGPEGATLGRGAGADVVIQDASISSLHAALEPCSSGFRLRDLGSTNGCRLNGSKVLTADLKHGDRFELGSQAFRYVVVARKGAPPTHHLDE
jgi:two-component system, NtrC family, response regulator GlrR